MTHRHFFRYSILSLIIGLIYSCGRPDLEYKFPLGSTSEYKESMDLLLSSQLILNLDSTSGITNQSISLFQADSKTIVSIFNEYDASIVLFDYQSGDLINKIRFDKDGAHGIGKVSNMGHFMDQKDSIFLFNHWEKEVILMNSKGEILRKYNLDSDKNQSEYYIVINSSSPAFKIKDRLYIPTQSAGPSISKTFFLIELNLNDNSITWHLKGPSILDDFFWGPITPTAFSIAYNNKNNEVITSWAKGPEVSIYNLDQLEHPRKATAMGSRFVSSFSAFPKKNNIPPFYGHRYKEIASTTNKKASFSSIQYDNTHDLYFRTMILPRTDTEYDLRRKGIQQTIIIFDSELDKIGEHKLPAGKYSHNLFFMFKGGLHVANLDEYEKDENRLVFDIYEPIKK